MKKEMNRKVPSLRESGEIVFRGIGQVMFQNNAVSGLLMLAGIACSSWQLALLALAGNIAGTLTAFLCGYSREDIREGLHGFNGTLTGIAIGIFMEINILSLLLLIPGAALSTLIAAFLRYRTRIPGYTAPFILSVWLLLIGCRFLAPTLLLPNLPGPEELSPDLLRAAGLHFGQVMFAGINPLSGLFFLAGISINSRQNAAYALWGALLPLIAAWWAGPDYTAFNAGLFGYNGVLCGIALSGSSLRHILPATIAILLSMLLQTAGMQAGITTLTAPFVLSVWIVSGIKSILSAGTASPVAPAPSDSGSHSREI